LTGQRTGDGLVDPLFVDVTAHNFRFPKAIIIIMFFSTRFSNVMAAALLLTVRSSLACECSGPTDTITTDFIKESDAVGRFFIHSAISPIAGSDDGELYYSATASKWYKGDIGGGNLIIKTSASGAMCGASVEEKAESILFGSVTYEKIPGYAGTVPTLTIFKCLPQKVATGLSPAEWATLAEYKNHVVCEATACDGFEKPTLDPLDCAAGTEYNETAVCQGQDNGGCGWTVSASCSQLPYPDVCLESHCASLDKPVLSCPSGTVMDSSTFACEKQTGGSCGWKGSATCKTVVPTVPVGQACALTACDAATKPVLTPFTCPTGMEYKETTACQGQTNGRCGWSVSSTCVKVADPSSIVCVEADCAKITKPTFPASFACATGYKLTTTTTCILQPAAGVCGWKLSGVCQKI
jgi:hypothetical protein